MEENSPTPISPTPQSPNQSTDSEEAPQEPTPQEQTPQQQNYPQNPAEQQNQIQDGQNAAPPQQHLTMGQDLLEENKTLFFASLPYDTTEESLTNFINQVAPVQNVRLLKRPDGTSKGRALCDFASVEDAEKVRNNCNGALFNGRTISVQNAENNRHPPPQRYNRRPQRRRYTMPYRDLDAPDDDDEPKRSYDLAPDEEPEKKNDYNRNQNYYHSYNRDRRPYHRRPYRSYDNHMEGGRIQDYRTRPNAPPPPPQGGQQPQEQPPMPY